MLTIVSKIDVFCGKPLILLQTNLFLQPQKYTITIGENNISI